MNELLELLDTQLETDRLDEHLSVLEMVKAVFGDDITVSFAPYGGN